MHTGVETPPVFGRLERRSSLTSKQNPRACIRNSRVFDNVYDNDVYDGVNDDSTYDGVYDGVCEYGHRVLLENSFSFRVAERWVLASLWHPQPEAEAAAAASAAAPAYTWQKLRVCMCACVAAEH